MLDTLLWTELDLLTLCYGQPRGFPKGFRHTLLCSFLVPILEMRAGPTVTGQRETQTSGNTLWERLYASWGSKSPAASLSTAEIQQQYGGKGLTVAGCCQHRHLTQFKRWMASL
jgi:hypothetical protein